MSQAVGCRQGSPWLVAATGLAARYLESRAATGDSDAEACDERAGIQRPDLVAPPSQQHTCEHRGHRDLHRDCGTDARTLAFVRPAP